MNTLLSVCLLLIISLSFKLSDNKGQLQGINWPFTLCGNGQWTPKVLTLDKAPTRNANDKIVITGKANDYIEFKEVNINVKLNGLFLHSETVPFSKVYDNGDNIEFEYTNFVPSFAPSGTYNIQFTHKDTSGKDNGCWAMSFKL